MPVKTKTTIKTKKRPKHFLKVYHPYLPLIFIIAFGFFALLRTDIRASQETLGYAINISQQALLDDTNKERAARNLPTLSLNNNLNIAATDKASDMVERDYWSHNTPDGKEPWYFMEQAGYSYSKAAENLAYGFKSSSATVGGWMNSPSHRDNLLDPNLTEVGFGILNAANYQSGGAETIVVAMYGRPSDDGTLVTTNGQLLAAGQSPQRISYIQSLTNGAAPWSTFIAGLALGIAGFYLLTKHALNLRRAIRNSERFIVHHPLLDVTLVAMVALVAIFSQTDGLIH